MMAAARARAHIVALMHKERKGKNDEEEEKTPFSIDGGEREKKNISKKKQEIDVKVHGRLLFISECS